MQQEQDGRSRFHKGILFSVLSGVCWGVAGVCGQFLFHGKGWSVDFLIPVRLLSAGVLMLLLARRIEKRPLTACFRTKQNVRELLIFGMLGIALCQYSYYVTIAASNATTATVLCYMGPVMIVLWVALRQRRAPSVAEVLSVALCTVGTFLLATHGDPGVLAISPRALIWGIISAVASAIYSVQPKGLMERCGVLTTVAWGMLAGGVALCLLRQPWFHAVGVFDGAALAALGGVVLLGSVASFGLYFSGLAIVGPVRAGVLNATEPLVSALLAVFWLKVVFTPADYLGFALILSTVFLLAAAPGKRVRTQEK